MSSDANQGGPGDGGAPTSVGGRPGAVSSTQMNIIRSHPQAVLELPSPEETWTLVDVDPKVSEVRRRLAIHGVIEIVDRVGDVDHRNVYRTDPRVYEYARAHIDRPSTLPCGHRGVRNVPGGEYTCFDDDCDQEFPRKVAEEVYADR